MAQLTVRKVDEALVRSLRIKAAMNGRSAEAEHRAILESALGSGASSFKAYLQGMPDVGSDEDFERILGDARGVEL